MVAVYSVYRTYGTLEHKFADQLSTRPKKGGRPTGLVGLGRGASVKYTSIILASGRGI